MLLIAGTAFSHLHKWSFVSILSSHRGQALVSYIVHFWFRISMVRSVLVMDFTRYVLSVEVFDELKPLFIFPSGCRMRLVVCQSISTVLAVSIIKSEV